VTFPRYPMNRRLLHAAKRCPAQVYHHVESRHQFYQIPNLLRVVVKSYIHTPLHITFASNSLSRNTTFIAIIKYTIWPPPLQKWISLPTPSWLPYLPKWHPSPSMAPCGVELYLRDSRDLLHKLLLHHKQLCVIFTTAHDEQSECEHANRKEFVPTKSVNYANDFLIIIIHSHHASVPNASRSHSSSVQTCVLCRT
jgi:hypothetical protein